jgi:hypothetical protein
LERLAKAWCSPFVGIDIWLVVRSQTERPHLTRDIRFGAEIERRKPIGPSLNMPMGRTEAILFLNARASVAPASMREQDIAHLQCGVR